MIITGKWASFDDNEFIKKFHSLMDGSNEIAALHAKAVLRREVAKLVYTHEVVAPKSDLAYVDSLKAKIEKKIDEVSRIVGIDKKKFHLGDVGVDITKAGARCKAQPDENWMDDPDARGCVAIIDKKTGMAKPLVLRKDSLLHSLAQHRFIGLRVYLLDCNQTQRDAVIQQFQALDHGSD